MKYYLNAVGIFVFLCITFGFAVPTLVSAKDTVMLFAGFAWVLASPLVVWMWVRKAFFPKTEV